MYDEWIASRRDVKVPDEMTDRVMAAVEKRVVQRKHYVRLADRINESQPARLTACLAAVAGWLPAVFIRRVCGTVFLRFSESSHGF